jgi:carbonic anhydrase
MKKSDKKKFATIINCMDGRIQLPVAHWVIKNYKIDYPDTITEAGPVKIIAENKDKTLLKSIQYRLGISINKHKSKYIFLVAHYDCAGNPELKSKQLKQLKKAIKNIGKWGFDVKEITGLWVGKNWKVKAYYSIKNKK